MLTGFKRIARSGFVGFWRNAYVSLAAIFVMTVTLFVFTSVLLMGQLLEASLTQIREKVDINVYLVPTAQEEDILHLKTALEALPDVREVAYTSREDALAAFEESHRDDELTIQALEELGDNPLGASLAVRAKETSQYESIDTFLRERQEEEDPENALIDHVNFFENKSAPRLLMLSSGRVISQCLYSLQLRYLLHSILFDLPSIRPVKRFLLCGLLVRVTCLSVVPSSCRE